MGTPLVRFGMFEVDRDSGELRRQGVRIKLQDQPFQALVALIELPHQVVTREQLQRRIWSAETNVDFDRGLNRAINRVREALGDDAENPRFVETLPQRGYRFIAPIEVGGVAPAVVPALLTPPTKPHALLHRLPRRRLLTLTSGLAGVPLLYFGYGFVSSRLRRIESIAVLPLSNLSGSSAQEYFSDGLTDELIGEISRIRSLRVISRTSVMQYKGNARKSLPEIARDLNVDAILEGTVVQTGQRVRITAQLIRARDDKHIWSEEYERDVTDILALQSEVAREVAHKIRLELTPGEEAGFSRRHRVKPEAYEAYLKGNFYLHKLIPGLVRSIQFFKEAIQLDASQPEAHAGLAEALCYAGIFGLRPSAETYPEARLSAQRALDLDASSAAAHNVLADVKAGYDWDLPGAMAEYQRALQLNPSHLLTNLWYAECLSRLGKFDEAIAQSQRALALDPVSPTAYNNRSMLLWRARRYDGAIRAGQQALDFDPNFVNALWWQGLSHAGKREFPRAIDCLKRGGSMNDGPLFRALLGHVYGLAGQNVNAAVILEELKAMSYVRLVSPIDFAIVYAGLADADSTFQWLEKAYQARATRIHELQSPYYDRVRSDPRHADLKRRVGLPV
ncbi:MAG: Adenylate cyclase [Candidatus Solibacter sp.]|nr:Adenylate cyclase [Candidatus Solibacter sp.]